MSDGGRLVRRRVRCLGIKILNYGVYKTVNGIIAVVNAYLYFFFFTKKKIYTICIILYNE